MALPRNLKEAVVNKEKLTNQQIYDIIRNYILEQISLASRKQRSEDSFKIPAWSEYQAYQLGSIKGLEKVLEFIPESSTKELK